MTKRCSEIRDRNSDPSKLPKLIYRSDVAERIAAFMSSEKVSSVSDITLNSKDGVRIPAVRALLIMSSPFLEKMLTKDPIESRSDVVNVPVSGAQLRTLVNYWYTGDCPLLRKFLAHQQCDLAVQVVELASVAEDLEEKKLLKWCVEVIEKSIQGTFHILSCLLEELTVRSHWVRWIRDNSFVEEVLDTMGAGVTLNCDTDGCKLPHGVLHLGHEAITNHFVRVLGDDGKGASYCSSALFQALLIWASRNRLRTINKEYSFDDESCILVEVDKKTFCGDRWDTAEYLAGKFDLSEMSPLILSEIVQKSGLVKESVINEAFRKLAVRFEERERRALDARDKLQSKIYKMELENRRLKTTIEGYEMLDD